MLETQSIICMIISKQSKCLLACLFSGKITLSARIKNGCETYLYHLRVQDRCNWVDDWVDARLADSCTDVKRAHRAALTQLSVFFRWFRRVVTRCTCASNTPWPFICLATILVSFCHFCTKITLSQLSLFDLKTFAISYYLKVYFFVSTRKALCVVWLMLETIGWVLVSFL